MARVQPVSSFTLIGKKFPAFIQMTNISCESESEVVEGKKLGYFLLHHSCALLTSKSDFSELGSEYQNLLKHKF